MIEIRELSVKVNVSPERENDTPSRNTNRIPRISQKAIINECIEQVSQMLKNKKER